MEPTQPAMTLPTHAEVGQRVSIRSHDPEGGFRDLLGHLVSVNQVRKKSGEIATFDPEKIALWKVVTEMERGTGIFLYDTMTRARGNDQRWTGAKALLLRPYGLSRCPRRKSKNIPSWGLDHSPAKASRFQGAKCAEHNRCWTSD
jgi:hypothetical protein